MRCRLSAAAALAAAMLAGACGGSAGGSSTAEEAAQDAAAGSSDQEEGTEMAQGAAGMAQGAAGVEVTGAPDEKPVITVPGGEPPTELTVADMAVGDGEEVPPGAEVTTHYVGVAWDSGEQFDSSWDRGDPISFPLDGVIGGWTEGIPGMRVGGRRLLVIPPELAYDDAPPPGVPFGPGATLVFVIDMVAAG